MESSKPKILMVYSNLGDGGTQRQRSILSGELHKKYELLMALFQNIQLFPFYGEIIDIKAATSKNPLISFKNLFKRILTIRNIIKQRNINIILSSSVIANMVCLLTKKIFHLNTPLIITFNNSLRDKSADMGIKGTISLFLNFRLAFNADKIVCVSNTLTREIIEMGFDKNKSKTIYNGLAIQEMEEKAKEPLEDEFKGFFTKNIPVIISVGRLTRQKNYSSLIKAFALLRKNHVARLVLVGGGEELEKLKEDCLLMGISDDVLFTGWQKNPYKFIKKSSIFVLSSLWEGFPNVLIEAMCLGLPVVSTNCPTGPDEIITHNIDGMLIPVNDPNSLNNALEQLITNKRLNKKIKTLGRKRALDFSIQNIASEWDQLFRDLLNNKS